MSSTHFNTTQPHDNKILQEMHSHSLNIFLRGHGDSGWVQSTLSMYIDATSSYSALLLAKSIISNTHFDNEDLRIVYDLEVNPGQLHIFPR